jgi:hypothetical protein
MLSSILAEKIPELLLGRPIMEEHVEGVRGPVRPSKTLTNLVERCAE